MGVRDAGLQDSGELVSIVIIGIVLNGVASCSARSLASLARSHSVACCCAELSLNRPRGLNPGRSQRKGDFTELFLSSHIQLIIDSDTIIF